MKQKTLLGFFSKNQSSSPAQATPAKKSAATLRETTNALSSSPTVAGDIPSSSLASSKRERTKSGASENMALSSTPACSDSEGGDAIMVDDDDEDDEIPKTVRFLNLQLIYASLRASPLDSKS